MGQIYSTFPICAQPSKHTVTTQSPRILVFDQEMTPPKPWERKVESLKNEFETAREIKIDEAREIDESLSEIGSTHKYNTPAAAKRQAIENTRTHNEMTAKKLKTAKSPKINADKKSSLPEKIELRPFRADKYQRVRWIAGKNG